MIQKIEVKSQMRAQLAQKIAQAMNQGVNGKILGVVMDEAGKFAQSRNPMLAVAKAWIYYDDTAEKLPGQYLMMEVTDLARDQLAFKVQNAIGQMGPDHFVALFNDESGKYAGNSMYAHSKVYIFYRR